MAGSSKRLLLLITVALLAMGSAGFYSINFDPEVSFWLEAIEEKIETTTEHREKEKEPIVFFVGGSSAAFSFEPQTFKSVTGYNAVNLGIHAGAGRMFQVELAMQLAEEKDIIILGFEHGIYADPEIRQPLGSRLWYKCRQSGIFATTEIPELDPDYELLSLRPGFYHCVTMALKKLSGRPIYRYSYKDIQPGGFLTTSHKGRDLVPSQGAAVNRPIKEIDQWLSQVAIICKKKNIQLCFSFPWLLTRSEQLPQSRSVIRQLATALSKHGAILNDPHWGALDDISSFADTEWHLTHDAAKKRTMIIGHGFTKQLGSR